MSKKKHTEPVEVEEVAEPVEVEEVAEPVEVPTAPTLMGTNPFDYGN